jgi:hypothetical protein
MSSGRPEVPAGAEVTTITPLARRLPDGKGRGHRLSKVGTDCQNLDVTTPSNTGFSLPGQKAATDKTPPKNHAASGASPRLPTLRHSSDAPQKGTACRLFGPGLSDASSIMDLPDIVAWYLLTWPWACSRGLPKIERSNCAKWQFRMSSELPGGRATRR